MRILLRNKGLKAILVNIFGGITRCDDIAQGILMARDKLADRACRWSSGSSGPTRSRAGTCFEKAGLIVARRMTDAIEDVVDAARGRRRADVSILIE